VRFSDSQVSTKTSVLQKDGAISKLNKNSFNTLQGHNIHCQQRELSKFLIRYQQYDFLAYCGVAGSISKMASQQEKASLVLSFEAFRSVIALHREFRARFKKDINLTWCVFF
jgi:hypothetical protein